MNTIDITGIDHAELLAALHNGTRALGFGALHDLCRDMTAEEAREIIGDRETGEHLYFDYVRGRPIKVSIQGDELHRSDLYDRDAGSGRCAEIVAKLRGDNA